MADYNPGPVPKEALAYFRAKQLKPGFDHRDVWREEHATAFTVAKAMKIDVLEDIRGALDQMLEGGGTFADFKKELIPTLQQKGWWGRSDERDPLTGEVRNVQLGSPRRLKTIYDTNMRTARAAGQWQRIQRTKQSHPILEYLIGPSEHHRVDHAAWAGTRLPADDPWWQTHMPQNGWGCKCHVRQMTQREADRRGGVTEAPPIQYREWINKRTGEAMQVPAGIDPGFDMNPGAIAHNQIATKALIDKARVASPAVVSPAIKQVVQSPAFEAFLAQPVGEFPVAGISAKLQRLLGVNSSIAVLSEETMAKQFENHAELTVDEYRLLPDVIDKGKVVTQGENKLVFFHIANRLYKAVIKATQDESRKLYLTSYYRTDEREMERDLKRGKPVRGWEEN